MTIATEQFKDRRLFERFSARFPSKYKDSRDEFGTKIYLQDVSAFGMRVISVERLLMNDYISLEVKLPDGQAPMVLSGRVVRLRRTEDLYWEAGIQFQKVELLRMSRLYHFIEEPSF